jgi:multiple sugar transport system permease protein
VIVRSRVLAGADVAGQGKRVRVMRRWRGATAARQAAIPWVMILPSLLLAGLIIIYPFIDIVDLSLHNVSRFGLMREFSGLANYARVFADPPFLVALRNTFVWTGCVVGGTVLVSIPVALVLNTDFHGRGIARALVMLPWAVSLTMASIVWLWGFNGGYGMINGLLQETGIIRSPIQWLARAETAFPVMIGIGILVSIPFTATILVGGLSSIPTDIYEAARIDGAGPWAQFRALTLPLLRPFVNIAIVLNVINVFNSFPIIWVMTEGGPDNATHILVTYLYELAFRLGRPGEAAAVALVMLVIVFAFTAVYLRMQAREAA